ncbi:MAG: choice-of-anchor D domain-containing protein [Myxococcales bacterium]|nr:choice-of-anchor D domain-containing protein [Myxococcales bacterium]
MPTIKKTISLVLLAVAGLFAGCGDSVQGLSTPDIVLTPTQIVFDGVAPGNVTQQALLVGNRGAAPLKIDSLRVSGPNGVFSVVDAPDLPLTIEVGQDYELVLEYVAPAEGVPTGTLTLATNDPDASDRGHDVDVPLTVLATAARVFVNPSPINFGRVEAGGHSEITAKILNIGGAPLTVSGYFVLGGNGVFSIVDGFAFSQPFTLSPDDEWPVTIAYDPNDNTFDSAALVVNSNDQDLTVEIIANGAEPCIEIAPAGDYDFGERIINQTHTETFTVRNCSDEQRGQPLDVSGIYLQEGGSEAFALDGLPGLPLELQPGEDRAFLVKFSPTVDQQVESATLALDSNDPYFPTVTVDLHGLGSNNVCPIARPLCTVRGSTAPPVTDLFVLPLDTLSCTGDSSRDEDGSIVDYIWSVDSAPDGSTHLPEPSNASNTQFFIDSAGRYTLNLTVVDDRGCASEPSPVTIVSRPDEDIHVELTWTTPGDLDESDTGFGAGSDVDLHLLHPNGCWTDTTWDCHFRARQPNWGDPGSGDDDPSLDLDDTDGGGPENINLDSPQNGVTYLVAAHYFDDHGFGDAIATVRVYIYGEVVEQSVPTTLSSDQWWVFASIAWPSTSVTPINAIYDDVPTCP